MDLNTIIGIVVMLAISTPLVIIGNKMVKTWDKRVKNWSIKNYPDSDEYMGSLAQGWGGFMLLSMGSFGLIIPIGYLVILLLCEIFQ